MSKQATPEIRGWFIPRVIPPGGAPEEIREQWVDIPLPFRYDRPVESPEVHLGHDINDYFDVKILRDAVSVVSVDAFKSLRLFARNDAARWWEDYFNGLTSDLLFAIEPTDQILPDDYIRRLLPGIELFDQIEV